MGRWLWKLSSRKEMIVCSLSLFIIYCVLPRTLLRGWGGGNRDATVTTLVVVEEAVCVLDEVGDEKQINVKQYAILLRYY